jgi:hypothetical protein
MRTALAALSLIVAACASVEHAPSLAPRAPLVPEAPAAIVEAPPSPVPVPEPEPIEPAPPAETPVELTLEKPFLPWARLRPEGRVAGSVHDQELARWNVGGTGDPEFISQKSGYHPAPRVTVDVEVVAGGLPKKARVDPKSKKPDRILSEASLLARSRKYGYWPFRLCFEAGLRRDQDLGGKTRIRFRVSRSGRISKSRLVDTTLRDKDVAKCLVDSASEIELLSPPRNIDVEAQIGLWHGDAPLPTLIEPPETKPSLDAEVILTAFEAARPGLSSCYREALGRDPALWGRIELGIELGSTGAIAKVTERDSHFPDKEALGCVIALAQNLTLPEKKGRPNFVVGFRLGTAPPPKSEP